jgi:hypothetical protein
VEVELWIPVAGSMALLGLLRIVLVLLWLKLGVGSGYTVSKNKKVTSRSSLLEICCKMDEPSSGRGGMGEPNPSSARLRASSPLAGRGGEEVVRKDAPFLDPEGRSCLSCC